MSEREEFEEWLASSCSRVYVATHHAMWTAWQAARASRWRSMDKLHSSDNVLVHWPNQNGHMVIVRGEIGQSPRFDPDAWHPLPYPPTKEKLENLK